MVVFPFSGFGQCVWKAEGCGVLAKYAGIYIVLFNLRWRLFKVALR